MKNLLRTGFALVLITALVVIGGCTAKSEPEKPAKDVIKEGLQGMQDAKSYGYKIDVDVDLSGPADQDPQKIKFKGGLAGVVHATEPTNPKFTLAMDGTLQLDTKPESKLNAEVRLLNKTLYAQVMNLPLSDEELPKELADTFLNKWWSYPLPEDVFKQLGVGMNTANEEQQKKIREIYEQTNFLNPEYVSNEEVGGVDSYKYKINFDKAKFVEFVEKVGKERGEPMSEGDKADLQKAMDVITFGGNIYVAAGDKPYISKIEGDLKVDAKEDEIIGTIKFAWTNTDLDKAADVKVPEGSTPFSPLFLAGLGLLGNVDDAALTDPSILEVDPEVVEETVKVPAVKVPKK